MPTSQYNLNHHHEQHAGLARAEHKVQQHELGNADEERRAAEAAVPTSLLQRLARTLRRQ